jgi:hypothetical protein
MTWLTPDPGEAPAKRLRALLAQLDGRPLDSLTPESKEVLDAVPSATKWARSFTSRPHRGTPDFARRTAPRAVSCAVEGISQACVPDPDERLFLLLNDAIAECKRWMPKPTFRPAPVETPAAVREHGESVEVR